MSKIPSEARNAEYLHKQAKALKKRLETHDPTAVELLKGAVPDLVDMTPDQISGLEIHQHQCQAAIAHQFGFTSWQRMIAYAKGKPHRVDGGIVISETPGLTLEQAINERAGLHGMPPIGTVTTSKHGFEWLVAHYDFFCAPSTFARYPGDCDFLPIVFPQNVSQRLLDIINEVDRCTSKYILFLDTRPDLHPFASPENIHCANLGGDPEVSCIFLDVAHAHETTIAHELGHLWFTYVEGCDDCRVLNDRSNHGKANQLDFIQSFVLDLKVDDLIAERGFDMSLINEDQINGLTVLREAVALGHQPPTASEALLNSLMMAAAILEQKRWPDEMRQRLGSLLDFFEAATPQIYSTAQELVEIVNRCGYGTREAARTTINECIQLGFRATGDDFDLDRDTHEATITECMQNKYPEQFEGCPVALKIEIGKSMARAGLSGEGTVRIIASPGGVAQITVEDAVGTKIGPLPVNYQLVPDRKTLDYSHLQRPTTQAAGIIHDAFGRLPGDPYYNTAYLPGTGPFERMAQNLVNSKLPDEFGRLPGHPRYNSATPPDQDPTDSTLAHVQLTTEGPQQPQRGLPWPNSSGRLVSTSSIQTQQNSFGPTGTRQFLPDPHVPMLSEPAETGITQRYMAGLGLSVSRARLKQIQRTLQSVNLYQYVDNNPVNKIDPSGLYVVEGCPPEGWLQCDGQCFEICESIAGLGSTSHAVGCDTEYQAGERRFICGCSKCTCSFAQILNCDIYCKSQGKGVADCTASVLGGLPDCICDPRCSPTFYK